LEVEATLHPTRREDAVAVDLQVDRKRKGKEHRKANELRDLSFGRLTWAVTKPSRHAIFLDLNLYIVGNRIKISTNQKALNIYLYLPGSSAHTLGMIKGIIYGQLLRYYEHNMSTKTI
jgi:hypothetical protein